MENPSIEKIINSFFKCDKPELLKIFDELLTALEAEENSLPSRMMSQNYETAQANPEIHTLPGNLKDARDSIFPYYWGTDGWYSKLHLENVRGPANYASLVGTIACLLKNPNLCVDTYSQRSNELEVKAITALANLLFYHTDSPWGVFTIGGTLSNLYAGKIGIERICPGASRRGLGGEKIAGITSRAAHYSNETLADWLGMGRDNLHNIPTDGKFSMRLDLLELKMDQLYQDKFKIAFIITTFGTTDAFGIDDIMQVREIALAKSGQYGVPCPQIHVDAAAGWPLCFLAEYDTVANKLGFSQDILPVIRKTQEQCEALKSADSVTIDFHKMGWGHYPSSAFIVNKRENLACLFRETEDMPYFSEADYRRDPALFTLETSRPAIGPYSVMASLNGIGLIGYQILVAHALEMADYLKKRLEELDYCKVLNAQSLGAHVVWWVLPKGRDARKIYSRLIKGDLEEKDCKRYFEEIRRLFYKRQHAASNNQKDASLSFTASTGYEPNGIAIPAWKAVFYNPKTDKQVIDDLITSLEEI